MNGHPTTPFLLPGKFRPDDDGDDNDDGDEGDDGDAGDAGDDGDDGDDGDGGGDEDPTLSISNLPRPAAMWTPHSPENLECWLTYI